MAYRNMETGRQSFTRKASFRSELLSSPILGHQKVKKASSPPRPPQSPSSGVVQGGLETGLPIVCHTVTEEDHDYSDRGMTDYSGRGMDESGPGVVAAVGDINPSDISIPPTTEETPPVMTAAQDFQHRIAAERARIQLKREQLLLKSREAEAAVAAEHEVLLKYRNVDPSADPTTKNMIDEATVTTTTTTVDGSPTSSWMEETVQSSISITVTNDSSSTTSSSSSSLVEPIHDVTTTTNVVDVENYGDDQDDDRKCTDDDNHDEHQNTDYLASTSNETTSRARSSLIHDDDDEEHDDEVRIDLLQSEDERDQTLYNPFALQDENHTETTYDACLIDFLDVPPATFSHHEVEDKENQLLGMHPAEDNTNLTKDLLLSSTEVTATEDDVCNVGMDLPPTNEDNEADLEMAAVRTVKIQPLSTTSRKRDQPTSFFCTKTFWIVLTVFFVAAIAVIVMMVFFFKNQAKLGKTNDASQPVAPLTPREPCELETNILPGCQCQDVNPTQLPPEVGFNRGVVLPFLVESGVNINETIGASSCSVENQALVFVSDLNNFDQIPPTNLQILQRYVLAVLYQSLGGDHWERSDLWLDPKSSECEWYGVVCSDPSQRIIQIELSDNGLNGTLPGADIGLIQSIRHLDFDHNPNLEGQLVSAMTRLPFLQSLSFADTGMRGTLPIVWSDGLLELQLHNTKMTGRVPTELGMTTRLRELDLSNNTFTGSIPTSLIGLSDLEFLDLSSNRFTGTLPAFWPTGYLTNLNVAHNSFNGSIPDPYSSSLSFLNFEDTSLTGTVPGAYCNLTALDSIVVDCDKYESLPLTCPCCQCPNS